MRLLVASLAICGLCGPAFADRADRADQLFKKGKKLLAQKKYPEACTAFEESDRVDPGIGAKLNVAKCYQEWGKLATAWRWYTDAQNMANQAKDERAPRIRALIEELDPGVPRLTIKAPDGATLTGVAIRLDGVVFDPSALGVERRVDPGPHEIDTIVDGAKKTKVIPVERGGSAEVLLDLPTAGPTASRPGAPPQPRAEAVVAGDPGRTRRLVGLGISGGGVLALGIAGIVTLGARGDYRDALDAHCQGATDMCSDDGLRLTHAARRRANIATVVAIGGLAAVAGGLVVYFTAPRAPRAPDAASANEHALYLAPSLVADGGGLVLGGAF